MRACTKCGVTKPLDEFYPRRADCKLCSNARGRAYHAANRARDSVRAAARYAANREAVVGYARRRRARRIEEDLLGHLLSTKRSNARHAGVDFSITRSDLSIPDVCPVLGIKIVPPRSLAQRRGPEPGAPTIDRIDSSMGYVPGNVRVVSHRANTLKSDATVAELELVLADLRRLRSD